MDKLPVPPHDTRYGFYYFPDTYHYRLSDLNTWLPELQSLGATWLTLNTPIDRAIPEAFIQGVLSANIQPILHFQMPHILPYHAEELEPLFRVYYRWGVRYIALFDRPNLRANWSASTWVQGNLVERFLDLFIPLAETAINNGLVPIFPPLEPGGDYWDTAFLQVALQGLQRRGTSRLLERLVIGAYAWVGNRSLDWGAGGPERWPATRPYDTPAGSQDHRGFRIFDWYMALSQAVLGEVCPILIMGAGSKPGDCMDTQSSAVDLQAHAWQNLSIARLMAGEKLEFEPVPSTVLACNFWLLSAPPSSRHARHAWYQSNEPALSAVSALKKWVKTGFPMPYYSTTQPHHDIFPPAPIAHYLLLPSFDWGISDWHLEVIRPFIKKHRPTVGFSVVEAAHAQRVTVIGGPQAIPDTVLDGLIAAGCTVERINGDGTVIATKLAEL